MSGIVGHTMYAILAAKAAAHRRLPVAPLIQRHWASYLAGSYLGCDIQTMPEAVCVDTGKQVGFGTVPLKKSPLTGGAVAPFQLVVEQEKYRPRDIHTLFYGRSHLTFGWAQQQQGLTLPWEHLPDYCSAVAEDAVRLFGPGERPLAYALGWITHLVGDGLIKSVGPGVTLDLLDGKYTRRNRPIQDLFTFHEVGRKELHLNWPALFADLAETPTESIQLHYMRIANPRGRLAREFPRGWNSAQEKLLHAVLVENRRYLKIYQVRILKRLELTRRGGQWECHEDLQETTGGLSYSQMVEVAEQARFRRALWQIAEAIADLFSQVAFFAPAVREMPTGTGPSWAELTKRWNGT